MKLMKSAPAQFALIVSAMVLNLVSLKVHAMEQVDVIDSGVAQGTPILKSDLGGIYQQMKSDGTSQAQVSTYLLCSGPEAGIAIIEAAYLWCKEIAPAISVANKKITLVGRTFRIMDFAVGLSSGGIKSATKMVKIPILKTTLTSKVSWLSPSLAVPVVVVRIRHPKNADITGGYMGVKASGNIWGPFGIRGGAGQKLSNSGQPDRKVSFAFLGAHLGWNYSAGVLFWNIHTAEQ